MWYFFKILGLLTISSFYCHINIKSTYCALPESKRTHPLVCLCWRNNLFIWLLWTMLDPLISHMTLTPWNSRKVQFCFQIKWLTISDSESWVNSSLVDYLILVRNGKSYPTQFYYIFFLIWESVIHTLYGQHAKNHQVFPKFKDTPWFIRVSTLGKK